jgi:hypothetical protein
MPAYAMAAFEGDSYLMILTCEYGCAVTSLFFRCEKSHRRIIRTNNTQKVMAEERDNLFFKRDNLFKSRLGMQHKCDNTHQSWVLSKLFVVSGAG